MSGVAWNCQSIVVVTPPSYELLDTADAMAYLRALSSEQALVSMFVGACRADLEYRLGRSLCQRTLLAIYQLSMDERSLIARIEYRRINLLYPPVQAVTLLEGQTDPDTWVVFPGPGPTGIWHVEDDAVVIDDLTTLQAVDATLHVRVTYTVGPTKLDPADSLMLLQYVAHRYMYREDDSMPEDLSQAISRSKVWQL